MKVNPISRPLPGEHIVDVEPALQPDIDLGWNRRLRLYTGRALSDTALKSEQANRAGRIATRGQAVSAGVVNGLEITLERGPDNEFLYQLTPGLGISAGGEDVVIPTLMRVGIHDTRVVATSDALMGAVPPDNHRPSGFNARDVGQVLSVFVNSSAPLPHVGILLLQPIIVEMVGEFDESDPCPRDPQDDAFEDWQLVDGCRLLYYAWPSEFIDLPNFFEPEGAVSVQHRQALGVWRNRIAYHIFQKEATLGPDELLPWMEFGVPLGVVAFDNAWQPLFIDNHAVQRSGGKPKQRSNFLNRPGGADLGRDFTGLLPSVNNPFLWQARIEQFSEQVAEEATAASSFADLVGHFAFLPPAGIMPKELLQFYTTQEARANNLSTRLGLGQFFPTYYEVKAVAAPLEQLDIPLEASADLAPFDLSAVEELHLLIPVPQVYYEPRLLSIEQPDPQFQTSIDQLSVHCNKWLARRQDVRTRLNELYQVIKGDALSFPTVDPEAAPDEMPDPNPIDPQDEQLKTPEETYGVNQPTSAPIPNLDPPDALVVQASRDLRDQLMGLKLFQSTYTVSLESMRSDLKTKIESLTPLLKFDVEKKQLSMTGPLAERSILFRRLSKLGSEEEDKPYRDALQNLVKASANDDLIQFSQLGLERFINWLDAKVQAVNDKVDLGFYRVHTDIYRVRQLILGNTNASRLATSPSLASIAQGQSAAATRQELEDFFVNLKKEGQVTTVPTPAGTTDNSENNLTATRTATTRAGSTAAVAAARVETNLAGATTDGGLSTGVLLTGVAGSVLSGALSASLSTTGSAFTEILNAATVRDATTDIRAIRRPAERVSPIDIIGQSPVVGAANVRTVTIAERLEAPKAPEAKLFTVSTKFEILNDIKDSGLYVDDIPVPGIAIQGQFEVNGQPKRDHSRRFADLRGNLGQILDEPIPEKVDDESAYFVGAVDLLNHSVGVLRSIEARIQEYRQVIANCQKLLATVRDLFRQANQRLQTINDELAETRHDVSVAKSLLSDEIARVDGINTRRDQVIQQVQFLAFQRPRFSELRLDVPVRVLDPAPAEPNVPARLNRNLTPPAEIRAMVDLFRHVPVRWLPHVLPFLGWLTTLPMLTKTLQGANRRAVEQVATRSKAQNDEVQTALRGSMAMSVFAGATPREDVGSVIQSLFRSQEEVVMETRQAAAHIEETQLTGKSWKFVHDLAAERLSLGDLIEGAHNRLDLSQRVARELDQIAQVATGLYEAFDGVLPIVRLGWAELLSQYDSPVNLRNLANLPRWSEIPLLERRSMQEMADWLYNRIDQAQPKAVGLMNDLVRVCILTASHAPVNAIIAGHVPRPSRATIGEQLELHTLDISKLHIGMQALVYRQNQVVARGVIEDLADGQVAARILSVQAVEDGRSTKSVALETGAQVHFMERILHETFLQSRDEVSP